MNDGDRVVLRSRELLAALEMTLHDIGAFVASLEEPADDPARGTNDDGRATDATD